MSHGSPELDEDAAKLLAMGQDPGPTLDDVADPRDAKIEVLEACLEGARGLQDFWHRIADERSAELARLRAEVERLRALLESVVAAQTETSRAGAIWQARKALGMVA